jgi:hypothetical protein
MRTVPPGTPTAEEVATMSPARVEQLVAKRLAFTRSNQWVWRSLLHHTCIQRTDAVLTKLRQTLEAGVRRGTVPDTAQTDEQREAINARQEQLRVVHRFQQAVGKYKAAIAQHRQACADAEIIPEQHDEELWSVLPEA